MDAPGDSPRSGSGCVSSPVREDGAAPATFAAVGRDVSSSHTTPEPVDSPECTSGHLESSASAKRGSTAERRLSDSLRFQERLNRQTELIARMKEELKKSQRRIADMEAADETADTAAPGLSAPASNGPSASAIDEEIMNRLVEEQDRNSSLNGANSSLRRQLDEVRRANASLAGDYLQLTREYDSVQRDALVRSEQQNRTEQILLERFSIEHSQMLQLWRCFQQLRRDYLDLCCAAKRTFNWMDTELDRVRKGTTAACQKTNVRMVVSVSGQFADTLPQEQIDSLLTETGSVDDIISTNVRRLTASLNNKDDVIRGLQHETQELAAQKQLSESQLLEKHHQENEEHIAAREQLANATKQLERASDERKVMEEKAAGLEKRLAEAEARWSAAQETLTHSRQIEVDLKRLLVTAVSEKEQLLSRIDQLERKLDAMAMEKSEVDSDARALQQRMMQLEEEIHNNEAIVRSAAEERDATDKALSVMESENFQLQRTVTQLHSQLANAEKAHGKRLLEWKQCSADLEKDLRRVQAEKDDALRKCALLHQADKGRIGCLQEENKKLLEQIENYAQLRQQFVTSSMRHSMAVADIQAGLGNSVRQFETSFSTVGSPVHSSTPKKRTGSIAGANGGRGADA